MSLYICTDPWFISMMPKRELSNLNAIGYITLPLPEKDQPKSEEKTWWYIAAPAFSSLESLKEYCGNISDDHIIQICPSNNISKDEFDQLLQNVLVRERVETMTPDFIKRIFC